MTGSSQVPEWVLNNTIGDNSNHREMIRMRCIEVAAEQSKGVLPMHLILDMARLIEKFVVKDDIDMLHAGALHKDAYDWLNGVQS